jgi:hypothetical protein
MDTSAVSWTEVGDRARGLSHAGLARAAESAAKQAVLSKSDSVSTAALVMSLDELRRTRQVMGFGLGALDRRELPHRGQRRRRHPRSCSSLQEVSFDEYLETSVPGVYATGDVKSGPAFTHLSYDDYRIMRANLLGPEKASTRDRIVPYTVFIDPLLAEGLNSLFMTLDA